MPGFGPFGRPGKQLAIAVGVVLFIIAAWFVVGRLSASSDRYESFYPSLAEADKDGAITRGWIPDEFLPHSSRSIHEVHDLSPSREWCAFEFVPADSQILLANLKHVDVLPLSVSHVPSPGVSWWPPVFVSNLDIEKIHRSGFELYFVERPATPVTTAHWLFAIDWSKGRGFFYYT
jgi:hypothetical protein